MQIANCTSIKQLMDEYLSVQTEVQQLEDTCVITLPLQTLDQRFVDVFIEPRGAGDYFLVNDGGKAVNELILQGMKITQSIEKNFGIYASRFKVAYTDEMFQTGAKLAGIPKAANAVAMCSALAMTEILEYVPQVEEETIEGQLGTILRKWGKKRAKITEKVKVNGELKQHQFDFLISPPRKQPVAISILNPTNGALSAAERFGFKVKDLTGTPFAKWRRIAFETRAEVWSIDARRIVEKCADVVIPVLTEERPTYQVVGEALDRMVA